MQCGMDRGVTGQEFSSLKSPSSQRKNEGRVWAAMPFVALLQPGAIQLVFRFHYSCFQQWEVWAKIALKWSLLLPLFCAPLACPALAPDFQSLTRQACRQGTSRVLPGLFPPFAHWTGEGGDAWPLWRWMDEEIKTSTGSIVPEHQKEQWHGRGFDHEANTGGERGWFEGENTPAHDLIKRRSHTGAWIYTVSVWTWTYCTVRGQSHSFTQACIVTWGTCGAALFDAHLCLYLRRSHTITRRSGRCAAV